MNTCKICGKELKNKKRTYCSNKCKFSDQDYNKSRVSLIKNDEYTNLQCKLCNWEASDYYNKSGSITNHLKKHNIIFDKSSYLNNFNIIKHSPDDFWKCPYCEWKTLDKKNTSGCIVSHFEKTHNLNINEIIDKNLLNNIGSKQKTSAIKQKFLLENEDHRIKCEVCNCYFKKITRTHLFKHGLTIKEYKEKYNVYNTASKYVSDIQSKYTTKYNLLHGASCNNNQSSLELDFIDKLKKLNINYTAPFLYKGKRFDLYIPDLNYVIEIDGDVFHKNILKSLTLHTVNGSANDYEKNKIMNLSNFLFFRIRYDKTIFNFNNTDELKNLIEKYKYIPNYNLGYTQTICEKEYFKKYIEIRGKQKLGSYIDVFLKFIRTFQPEFPYPDLEEDLGGVIDKISKYDLSSIYDETTKEFSNNISTIGHNYLKHYFHSYWDSKFNKNPSPKEAWKNDNIMKSVIEYRIGCNDSNEVFDFSLHQLVRGLSARRITVSFFKPILAAAIYSKLLGDKKEPVVLDPCCGFGGRLLGFKSRYPNGTYIGCEPNIETYNELIKLKDEAKWDKVEIYNCRFEDYVDKNNNYDLIFTSIPYYDLEIYDNKTTYKSFEEWKDTFIKSIEKYKSRNCYINLPIELSSILNWNNIYGYIKNNKTHFSKTGGYKNEVIIKL